MKIVFNLLLITVAAALGLAVGYLFRGKLKRPSASPAPISIASTQSAQRAGKSMRQLTTSTNDTSPLATQLERDLSMTSGVTRWLYWLDALEKATPQDFPRLVRMAQGNPTAMRFVAARWVEVDPRHMFDTIVAASGSNNGFPVNELAQILFEEWPKRDPKSVIEALDSNAGPTFRGWRMNVAADIFNNDVELGLGLMSRWHMTGYIPLMKGVSKWAAADPLHAAQFTYDNPVDLVSREMMKAIGKEWVKTDPAAALAFANSKPGELGSVLANSALKEWAATDLKAAADWLADTDPRTRNRLASSFVESWGKQDAAGALEWCALNLTGSSLAQAVGGVLTGLAQKDLAAAQSLVANMGPSTARAQAAAAVAQKAFPNTMSEKPIPSETVAWLNQLDPDSMKRALNEVYWRWMNTDSQGFADFLKTANTSELPSHIYSNLARNLARKNPSEALEWAAELPSRRAVSVGGEAFAEWRRSQPEAAMTWLNELPPDDSRREPFFETAIRTLVYDTQAAQQLAAMNASDRAAARRVIEGMSLPDDRRTKLLGMLK